MIERTATKGPPQARFSTFSANELPPNDVLVKVEYSTVNYKDGLALTGGPIARRFPMVAGIDLAGVVEASDDPRWQPGQRVLVNGFGLSETEWGGYSTLQRLKGDWLVQIPDSFSSQQAMSIGTAGYTAMLCVMALQDGGVSCHDGPILVTGASGGVGSVAVMLLHELGYEVVASTGRCELADYLKSLGATDVIERGDANDTVVPLAAERWAGVVDSVGGKLLAQVVSTMRYGGTIAACGMTGGKDIPASIFPFILRNVRLQGIDSVMAPMESRIKAWSQLAQLVSPGRLESLTRTVAFDQVFEEAESIVNAQTRGRTVVKIDDGAIGERV